MVFLILVIIIFIGIATFLLSLGQIVSQSEYLNLYTHSLLSTLMKKDTGFTEPSCRTVSDILVCSFLSPTYLCGNQDCFTLAEETVNNDILQYTLLKEQFRYLLTVEPEGFAAGTHRVEIGEPSLKSERTDKFTANERIQKVAGGNQFLFNIQLVIARKEPA